MDFQTADLVDAYQAEVQSCAIQFRQFGGRMRWCGKVRTLRTFEDNARLKALVATAGDDCVLVVDGGGSLRTALVGDLIAEMARAHGWAGLVLWGAVRDTVALAKLDIGIKAIGSNPSKSGKMGFGEVDVPLNLGGAVVRPGDWLYSDEDGLLISPRQLVP